MGAGGGGDRRLRGRMGRVGEWMKINHVREKKRRMRGRMRRVGIYMKRNHVREKI